MARSYYTDGTSALDLRAQGASRKSNVVSFERRTVANSSRCEAICQHVFRGDPCAHDLYSFETCSASASDKLKSVLAVVIPALAMLMAIVGPVLM